jgi:hypothetical protein
MRPTLIASVDECSSQARDVAPLRLRLHPLRSVDAWARQVPIAGDGLAQKAVAELRATALRRACVQQVAVGRNFKALFVALAGAFVALAVLVAATANLARAADNCPNAQFRTGPSASLPDCRAYEMVSPPDKANAAIFDQGVGDDGNRVVLQGQTAGDPPSLYNYNVFYVAERGAAGWKTAIMGPAAGYTYGIPFAPDFTADLTRAPWLMATSTEAAQGRGRAYTWGIDGSWEPASPPLVPLAGTASFQTTEYAYQGASADLSHILFSVGTTLTSLLPGDPPMVAGKVDQPNLYEAYRAPDGSPALRLVQLDSSGNVLGGGCGATLGAVARKWHAVSANGSIVYFSTRTSQPASSDCRPSVTTNKLRVYRRTGGTTTVEVSQSQCTRTAPACSTNDDDDLFEGASVDGSRVFIETGRQLTNSDLDAGADLYLYDASPPAGQPNMVQVSVGGAGDATPGSGAGVQGVLDYADDGSRVYFVATGVLTTAANALGRTAVAGQNNLYVFERTNAHPAGRTAFIATLGSSAGPPGGDGVEFNQRDSRHAAAVPILGQDTPGRPQGGDGHVLVFRTVAPVTPDDTDSTTDIFRYDDTTGQIDHVSKGEGSSGNADMDVDTPIGPGQGESEVAYGELGRWVSDDGRTIAFTSGEALTAADKNRFADAYAWRDGKLSLISNVDGTESAVSAGVSASGDDILFTSGAQLAPEDGDGALDVYDARIGGGFAPPAPGPVQCDVLSDHCQAKQILPERDLTPGSATFLGRGNILVSPAVAPSKVKVVTARVVKGSRFSIRARVPGSGVIRAFGPAVKATTRHAPKRGTYRLNVSLDANARKTLKHKHTLTVMLRISFSPKSGSSSATNVALTVKG